MLKAFAVKALAAAFGGCLAWSLPAQLAVPAVVGVTIATILLLTYFIGHPASEFLVPVVSRLPTREPVVALTFDDGPDPRFTPQILDVLRAHDARATFFVLGARAQAHPDLIRRILDEGHAIGTHTHHHSLRFHFGTPGYVRREIDLAVAAVERIAARRPRLFRPPQGLRTPCFAAGWRQVREQTCVTWSARGLDTRPTSAAAIVARLVPRLSPGAIVTLHDGAGLGGTSDRHATVEALPMLLRACRDRGLRCVALDDAGGPA